jgi:Protein of unknown function (DUF4065)
MNRTKFREAILYIAGKSQDDPRFGAVKLNKILFYADFEAYRRLGHSITEDNYRNLPEGPVPWTLEYVRDSLLADGLAQLKHENYYGQDQYRLVPSHSAAVGVLSSEETRILDEVITDLWLKNATQVSDKSHEEFGWKTTALDEVIPYRTAWISSERLNQEQIEMGRQIARQRGLFASGG